MTKDLSPAKRKDPSMLGQTDYARIPLDHYPTPPRATQAFLDIYGDDLGAMCVWEPFCGTGAISKIIEPLCRSVLNTDITAYEGFDPDALQDFFEIKTEIEKWTDEENDMTGVTLREIADRLEKPMPDAIVTNPPYGKDAERFVRHALKLLEPEKGFLAVLCRHEWDAARGRSDIFDHPAFASKVTLRFRPKWIEGSTGAPRFSYAWYVWDWTKASLGKAVRAEVMYAG